MYLLKFPVSKTNPASEDWPFVSIFLDLSRVLSETFSSVLSSNSSISSGSVTKTRFLILMVCLLKFPVSKTNQASEDRSFVSIFLDLSRVLSETLSSVRNSNSSLGSGNVTKTRAGFSYSLDLSCVYTKKFQSQKRIMRVKTGHLCRLFWIWVVYSQKRPAACSIPIHPFTPVVLQKHEWVQIRWVFRSEMCIYWNLHSPVLFSQWLTLSHSVTNWHTNGWGWLHNYADVLGASCVFTATQVSDSVSPNLHVYSVTKK